MYRKLFEFDVCRSSRKRVDPVCVARDADQRIVLCHFATLRGDWKDYNVRARRKVRIRVHTRASETRKRRGIAHLITNSIKMNASSETNSTYLH